jgi:outer membrane protein TolC
VAPGREPRLPDPRPPPYRQTYGGFADWGSPLDDRHSVSIGLQAGYFEYAGANSVRNSDFQSATIGLRRILEAPWRPQIDVSVNVGRERNDLADRQDLSRDLYGARIGVALAPLPAWTLAASAVYQQSRYRAPDAVLLTTRDDRYTAGELVLSWAITPSFSVRAEVSGAKNDSNIALYEYRRTTALIKGRYEIR